MRTKCLKSSCALQKSVSRQNALFTRSSWSYSAFIAETSSISWSTLKSSWTRMSSWSNCARHVGNTHCSRCIRASSVSRKSCDEGGIWSEEWNTSRGHWMRCDAHYEPGSTAECTLSRAANKLSRAANKLSRATCVRAPENLSMHRWVNTSVSVRCESTVSVGAVRVSTVTVLFFYLPLIYINYFLKYV